MKLRVGIVGLGDQWEGRHLPALRMLADRFEVRGVCEQVSHRAERAAKELATAAVDGFRALAARDDIDAILYLADQWFGATPILAACDKAKVRWLCVEQDRCLRDPFESLAMSYKTLRKLGVK